MSENDVQHQNTDEKLDFPSLNLLYELAKERLASQQEQKDILDSKANFILGSATALVSAALVLQAVSQPQHATPLPVYCIVRTNAPLHALPMIILLVMYLIVLFSAFPAYKIRIYKYAPELEELYKNYLFEDESETKAKVFRAMLTAYRENIITIGNKVLWLKVAFVFLGVEAMALVVYLLYQTTC